jgi:hypothetical protein
MQAGDSFRIVVRRGPQPNQVFELKDDVLNLGRDITNTITINDREVSRHHLRFTRSPEGYTVEDLGSTNGTFINGKRLTGAVMLKNGDMIGLGETVTLGYEVVRPGGATATPSPYQQAAQAPQAPQAGQASPFQPPAQNPFQQPAQPAQASPYQPPAQQNPYQQSAPAQAADPYQQPSYGQQPAYGAPQDAQGNYYAPQGYGAPPPPGYDYDPYAMREQEERNPWRLVLFGCLGLLIFCCCFTVIAAVAIDSLNLYCQIPILNDILQALGVLTCAG